MSYEIPKVQKAIVATKIAEDFKVDLVEDYPVPQPGHGEILVRLTSTGVCHSDLSLLQDHWSLKMAPDCKISGHEGSGYIVKHGAGVDSEKYPVGTKVGVPLQTAPCYSCYNCTVLDASNYCSETKYYGTNQDGTFQQYCIIKDTHVIPIPDGVDPTLVGPVLCGGVTVYRGLKETGCRAGQWVVIAGAGGGLGSMAVQFAKEAGYRTIGIDTGDDKKAMATKLGLEVFVDFKTQDVVKTIMEVTGGRGAAGVLMLVPSEFTYNQAPAYMATGSTLVTVGLPKDDALLKIPPIAVAARKLKIAGTYIGTKADIMEALDFVKRGKVTPFVTVRKMSECQQTLEELASGKVVGRIVLDLE